MPLQALIGVYKELDDLDKLHLMHHGSDIDGRVYQSGGCSLPLLPAVPDWHSRGWPGGGGSCQARRQASELGFDRPMRHQFSSRCCSETGVHMQE